MMWRMNATKHRSASVPPQHEYHRLIRTAWKHNYHISEVSQLSWANQSSIKWYYHAINYGILTARNKPFMHAKEGAQEKFIKSSPRMLIWNCMMAALVLSSSEPLRLHTCERRKQNDQMNTSRTAKVTCTGWMRHLLMCSLSELLQ